MNRQRIKIDITERDSVSAVLTFPEQRTPETAVIVAHGAGNDMEHALLVSFCEQLAAAGYLAVRFNFPYTEQGRKAPDRPELLEATWRKVYAFVKNEAGYQLNKIFTAGKSMGGRIASQMLAEDRLASDGMIFLGYPLHPAGHPEKLRDAHLPQIKVPMLFFAGTRDALCHLELLQDVLQRIKPKPELEVMEGGDHSFHVPKSSGLTMPQIYARIAAKSIQWMEKQVHANRK